MIIYPAIDLLDGACIRLKQGNYDQKKVYHTNPLEMAQHFEENGATHLHLVDLDGAQAKKLVNVQAIKDICKHTSLSVDLGGGIQSKESAVEAFDLGVAQINVGSLAVKSPLIFIEMLQEFGAEKCLLSVDVKRGFVTTYAWSNTSRIHWKAFVGQFIEQGLQFITSTDIEKDGMLKGPAFSYYRELSKSFPKAKIIASGGVSNIADLQGLGELNLHGTIVGKAFYEKRIPMNVFNLSNQ